MKKPSLVYHADWSSRANNRWFAKAKLGTGGRYTASTPESVGELNQLLGDLKAEAGDASSVFAGFDFPIGVPEHYAERAKASRFTDFLRQLGTGDWSHFYSVCARPQEVSVHRPFYPVRYEESSCSQKLFLERLEAANMDALLRRCERGGEGQRRACSLFWTIGGNQVGKGAIVGWRDVLVPALTDNAVRLWPFDGRLEYLFQPGHTVIAETYPAECYGWFSDSPLGSKTDVDCRKKFGAHLLSWATKTGVSVEPRLETAINAGFRDGEDDAFDAVVGLFGMLKIVLEQRDSGEPGDKVVSAIEGWILGRQANGAVLPEPFYCATTDPDLSGWLHWASESGEAPVFVKTVAEAASMADLKQYHLLRQVLLELKLEYPHPTSG